MAAAKHFLVVILTSKFPLPLQTIASDTTPSATTIFKVLNCGVPPLYYGSLVQLWVKEVHWFEEGWSNHSEIWFRHSKIVSLRTQLSYSCLVEMIAKMVDFWLTLTEMLQSWRSERVKGRVHYTFINHGRAISRSSQWELETKWHFLLVWVLANRVRNCGCKCWWQPNLHQYVMSQWIRLGLCWITLVFFLPRLLFCFLNAASALSASLLMDFIMNLSAKAGP